MEHGAIRHLGFILEVDGIGWVANLYASDLYTNLRYTVPPSPPRHPVVDRFRRKRSPNTYPVTDVIGCNKIAS